MGGPKRKLMDNRSNLHMGLDMGLANDPGACLTRTVLLLVPFRMHVSLCMRARLVSCNQHERLRCRR